MSTAPPSASIPYLSIVVPVYNEVANIRPLADKIRQSLDGSGLSYEVLYVDDGSRDATFATVSELHAEDGRFKGVQLLRNQGKSEAYMAGFEAARGQLVATMDGDLQDDPADLLKLIQGIEEGMDLVKGWKQTGKSSKSTFYLSRLFNSMIRKIAKTDLHDLNCPLRVMRAEVAKNLYIYASLHRYIPLLVGSLGFRIGERPVANYERLHGQSNYKWTKYVESIFDLMTVLFVTYYRKKPLQFLGPIGLSSFGLGFVIDFYYLFLGLTNIEPMRNNIPSLLLGIALIMIGVQIVLTGLMGEMISRELGHAQRQTQRLIKSTVGLSP